MKKTVWKIVLLTTLILLVALALAACGGAVKFKLNFIVDGKVYDTVDTAGQEAIALPENPTKEGDEFDGWYWDNGTWERPFTANSLLDAPLSSDMNVYAKWKSDDIPKVDPSAAEIVSAPAFEISRNALSLTLPNATESYSFLGQITVSAGANWQVSTDMQGLNAIPTKTVPLNPGDNTFYLLVTSANGEGITLYTVTIRRRPIYTVSFNANGGNSVTALRAEEDSTINPPSTTRTGYTFAGWDYDFTKPIKGNLTTAAKWTSNTDTSYTVEYYLQNADATGYDLEERVPLMGTTASSVTAEQKTYPHFTYKPSGSTKTGTIAPDGSLVLKLYYTRDTYTVTFVGNGGTLESGNATQKVRYGNAATIPTFARKGYSFAGWDKESNAVSEDLTVTAEWEINTYTVSYDVNCGEPVANPVTYQITDDVTLDEPQREYYCFLGWYTASDEKVTNLQGNAGDLALTAKWECYFTLNGNTITGVSSSCRQKVNEIVIPDSLNGTTITGIAANAFANYTGLTSVAIPDGVTSIGEGAFGGCSSLASITIPFVGGSRKTASDTYQYPFGYIFGTSSYTGGVETTQSYYGSSTSSRTTTAYYIPSSLKSVTVTGGYIPYGAFFNCSGLTSVTIPDSVTGIGTSAFSGCSALQSITIPFVGGSRKTASDTYQYPFGYIFGTSSYTGGVETTQSYYGSSTSSLTNTTYYIPSSLKSVTVTGGYIPYDAFQNCTGLTSVTIPDSVTSIGERAFYNCTELTSVTIPDSVTSIGNAAFYGCSGLTSITIPDGVTSIGDHTFYGCRGLTSVTIPDGVTSIGRAAFAYCSGLTSITIPDSVTSIGGNAFQSCTGLTSITIPDSVTSIGWGAFSGCSGLTSVVWNATNCTSAGLNSNPIFSGCSNLTTVTIGDKVKTIPPYAFNNCSGLTSVYYTGDVAGWCGITFNSSDANPLNYAQNLYINGTLVTDLVIPDSVTSIGSYAFLGCSGLTSVTIGNGVTSIGNYAFAYCSGLTSITIPNSVKSIGNYVFYNCTGLTSVTIPDGVKSIGERAFSACRGLTSVTIPDSVTSIGYEAFEHCSGLTSITIPNGVTSIGHSAFYNCSGLTSITVTEGNPVYHSAGNCLIETASKTLIAGCKTSVVPTDGSITSIGDYAFYNCTGLTSVTIGNGVTSIGDSAFSGCKGLTSITIPDSVTSIGGAAFYGCYKLIEVCNLSSLPITAGESSNGYVGYYAKHVYSSGESYLHTTDDGYLFYDNGTDVYLVTYYGTNVSLSLPDKYNEKNYAINQYAFYGCSKLTLITIPNSVTSIGNGAFYGCTGLTSVTIPDSVTSIGNSAFDGCTGLTGSLTIPDGVTSIGNYAFYDCSKLTSVTIPDSVTSIGSYAFYGCTGLTSVTIPDSVTSIGAYAFRGCSGLTSVTFQNTSGWYVTQTKGASSGTNVTVTNASTNATNLKSTYYFYYWYRK